MNTTHQHSNREANLLTLAAGIVCALAFTSAMSPLVENATTVVLVVLAAAAVAVQIGRRIARAIRWRREDREDALAAAAWQAVRAAETAHVGRVVA